MAKKSIKAKKWKRLPKEKVFEKRPKYFEATRVYWQKVIEIVRTEDYEYEIKH